MPSDHDAWLGLDIGASKLLGCVVNARGEVRATRKVETRREEGRGPVLQRIVALARDLLSAAQRSGVAVHGVGAGFAGLVDHAAGRVRSSIMLPGWDDVPLAHELSSALDRPACVDNDATAAGLGELRSLGSPPGLNMVLLTIGTGIGGALVLDGRPYRGARGFAAEFGNTTIDWRGPRCWCGNRGCLNALASGSAIAAAAGHATVEAALRAGDARAQRAILEAAAALGAGIANLVNIFNPDRVVLAGGVAELGEAWLAAVRAEVAARAFAEAVAHVRIERSVRGYDVGAVGAAYLAREAMA